MTTDYRKTPEALSRLTDTQYEVTQNEGTEPPFRNEYWNNHEAGIYVDVVSGEPLFSSLDKYDSRHGLAELHQADRAGRTSRRKTDWKLLMPRTEVRSSDADWHLGHVFKDGPRDAGGLRYCMNSASLRFIPVAELEAEGYGAVPAPVRQRHQHGGARIMTSGRRPEDHRPPAPRRPSSRAAASGAWRT